MPSDTERDDPDRFDSMAVVSFDLFFLLGRAHRAVRRRWEAELAGSGVTAAQSGVVLLVASRPGVTQQQVAEELATDVMNARRMIAQLLERGFLRRERDQADQRALPLELTAEGMAVQASVRQAATRMRQELMAEVGEQQYEELAAGLYAVLGEKPPDHPGGPAAHAPIIRQRGSGAHRVTG